MVMISKKVKISPVSNWTVTFLDWISTVFPIRHGQGQQKTISLKWHLQGHIVAAQWLTPSSESTAASSNGIHSPTSLFSPQHKDHWPSCWTAPPFDSTDRKLMATSLIPPENHTPQVWPLWKALPTFSYWDAPKFLCSVFPLLQQAKNKKQSKQTKNLTFWMGLCCATIKMESKSIWPISSPRSLFHFYEHPLRVCFYSQQPLHAWLFTQNA